MPQAVPAIIAGVKAAAIAFAASYKAHLIVRVATAVGLAVISGAVAKKLAKKPSGSTGGFDQGTELKLKLDPQMPRQIAVGRACTGGSLVAAWTYTNPLEPDSPNKYLIRIIAISDFPTNRIINVWEGNKKLTFNGDLNTDTDAGTTGLECMEHRSKTGTACMWLKYIKGQFTPRPCYPLTTAPETPWTEEHLGIGVSYIWYQLAWDPDAFPNGEPGLTFEVEGAAIYDNRFDSTLGGRSGDQRLDDIDTWEYSDNTAAVAAQVLRGFYVNDKLMIGAQADEDDLPDTMLIAALNTCDQSVATLDGTERRYRCGTMISADQTISSILEDLQLAMDGSIYDRAGEVTILPGGTRTPVMDLDDSDLIWTDEKSWQPKADIDSLYNYVTGSWVSPEDGFVEKPLAPRHNATWETDDGGERLSKAVNMKAVWSSSQAQRTLKRIHNTSRFQGITTAMYPFWCAELEQGDWHTLTSDRWNMETKLFEVVSIGLTPDLRWAIISKEVSADIDGWDPVEDEHPDPDVFPPAPSNELVVPILQVTPYTLEDTLGALKLPGFHVTVTNISRGGNITYIEFQGGYFIGTTLTNVIDYGTKPVEVAEIEALPGTVIPGATYAFRARSFNGVRYSNWSPYYTGVASGEFIVPDSDMFGGKTPAEWVVEINQLIEDGNQSLAELDQLIKQQRQTATSVLQLFQQHLNDRDYLNPLTHIGDTPHGTIIIQEQVRTNDLVELTDAIAVWNGDHSAVILKIDTVQIDTDGTTIANQFESLVAKDNENAAAIVSEETARVDGDEANAHSIDLLTTTFEDFESTISIELESVSTAVDTQASWWTLLGSEKGDHSAFVLNGATTFVDATTSLGTYRTGVSTSIGNNTSAISTEETARVTGDNANASALTTYKAEVGSTYATISNLNYVDSYYGAKVGTTLDVNKHIVGWSLNNNGQTGGAVFVVDYFAVINSAGTVAQTVFSISGSLVKMTNVEIDLLKVDTVYATNLRQNTLGNVGDRSGGSTGLTPSSGTIGSSLSFTSGPGAVLVAFAVIDVSNLGGGDQNIQFYFNTDAITIPQVVLNTTIKAGTRDNLSFMQMGLSSATVTTWSLGYITAESSCIVNSWHFIVLSMNRMTS